MLYPTLFFFGFYLYSYLQALFLCSNLGSIVHLNAFILYSEFHFLLITCLLFSRGDWLVATSRDYFSNDPVSLSYSYSHIKPEREIQYELLADVYIRYYISYFVRLLYFRREDKTCRNNNIFGTYWARSRYLLNEWM